MKSTNPSRFFLLLAALPVLLSLAACLKAEAIAQDCSGGGADCLAGYLALEVAASKPNYPVIFLTTATYDGLQVGSETNADSLCMGQIPSGISGTFKAMLFSRTTAAVKRRASITANAGDGQLDWVLKAKQSYMRPDGTVIGTTNANALFSFPLTASFATSGSFWTGLKSDWTNSGFFPDTPCNDGNNTAWRINGTSDFANIGDATATGSASIASSSSACSSFHALLCVEQ